MKEKILACAVTVFNQKGIQQSTLRDIARELSISDGHLRYYFKTKEELILNTFSDMDKAIAALAVEGGRPADGEVLIEAITKSFEVMDRYAYFFTESVAQLEQYPQVYLAYQQLIVNRKSLFVGLFEQYKANGVFSRETDPVLFPLLFEQFFIISDNWVKYARLPANQEREVPETIRHYVAVCIGLFLPYFNAVIREQVLAWLRRKD